MLHMVTHCLVRYCRLLKPQTTQHNCFHQHTPTTVHLTPHHLFQKGIKITIQMIQDIIIPMALTPHMVV